MLKSRTGGLDDEGRGNPFLNLPLTLLVNGKLKRQFAWKVMGSNAAPGHGVHYIKCQDQKISEGKENFCNPHLMLSDKRQNGNIVAPMQTWLLNDVAWLEGSDQREMSKKKKRTLALACSLARSSCSSPLSTGKSVDACCHWRFPFSQNRHVIRIQMPRLVPSLEIPSLLEKSPALS